MIRYVGIGINPNKTPLFSDDQRLYLLTKVKFYILKQT